MFRRQLLPLQKEPICQILHHMSEEIPLICHGCERIRSTSNMLITERRIYRIREIVCKDIKKTNKQSFKQLKNSHNCVRFPTHGNAVPASKFL